MQGKPCIFAVAASDRLRDKFGVLFKRYSTVSRSSRTSHCGSCVFTGVGLALSPPEKGAGLLLPLNASCDRGARQKMTEKFNLYLIVGPAEGWEIDNF